MQGRRRFLTTSCLLLWTITTTTAAPIVAGENPPPSPPTKSTADSTITTTTTNNNDSIISHDELEDEILRETIEAGRGHRDSPGTRDQWETQEEHIGERSSYDMNRRPPSPKVERLLNLYRLTCDDCSYEEATAKINAYVVRTKEEVRQAEKRERKEWWKIRGMVGGAVVALAFTVWFTLVQSDYSDETAQRVIAPDSPIQPAPVTVVRPPAPAPPTWLDNEKKEIWNDKQEKQFQKALREFGGVNKKERYVLIAAQVLGKSRIECLTHHRMQQLMDQERLKNQ